MKIAHLHRMTGPLPFEKPNEKIYKIIGHFNALQ